VLSIKHFSHFLGHFQYFLVQRRRTVHFCVTITYGAIQLTRP